MENSRHGSEASQPHDVRCRSRRGGTGGSGDPQGTSPPGESTPRQRWLAHGHIGSSSYLPLPAQDDTCPNLPPPAAPPSPRNAPQPPLPRLNRAYTPFLGFGGTTARAAAASRNRSDHEAENASSELRSPLLSPQRPTGDQMEGPRGGEADEEPRGAAGLSSEPYPYLHSSPPPAASFSDLNDSSDDHSGALAALMGFHSTGEIQEEEAAPRPLMGDYGGSPWAQSRSWDELHDFHDSLDHDSDHSDHSGTEPPLCWGDDSGSRRLSNASGGSESLRRRLMRRRGADAASQEHEELTAAMMRRLSGDREHEEEEEEHPLGALEFGQGAPLEMPRPPHAAATAGSSPPVDYGAVVRQPSGVFRRISTIFANAGSQHHDSQGSFASAFADGGAEEQTGKQPPRRRRNLVVVDDQGKATLKIVEKLYMTLVLGVPSRDIRVLDPHAPRPYPSAVFIREQAVVLNLEGVKAIVTRDQAFLLAVPVHRDKADMASVWAPLLGGNVQQADDFGFATAQGETPTRDHPFVVELSKRVQDSHDSLPFSLQVLDAAMAGAHKQLEKQVTQLEQAAQFALDALVIKVSRENLERVQAVKSKSTKLAARVEKLKEEIDKLLDDDDDMRALYLRQYLEQEHGPAGPGHLGPPGQWTNRARSLGGRNSRATPLGGGGTRRGNKNNKGSSSASALSHHQLNKSSSAAAGDGSSLLQPPADPGSDAEAPSSDALLPKNTKRHNRTNSTSKARQQLQRGSLSNMRKSKSELALAKMQGAEAQPRVQSRFNMTNASRATSDGAAAATPGPQGAAKAARPKNTHRVVGKDGVAMPGSRPIQGARNKKIRRGHADVQEAEALLEVLVTSMEFLESRLAFLKERIDDTEDLLLIELDSNFNELQFTHVSLLVVGLSTQACSLVAVIYGQNLCQKCSWHSDSGPDANPWLFYFTIAYTFVGMALLSLGFFAYIQVKGLSYMPGFSYFSVALDTIKEKSATRFAGLG